MTKKRVFDIIQVGNATDIPSRIFDVGLIIMVLTNLFIALFETFDASEPYLELLNMLELFTVVCFSIEYVLRVWTAEYLYPAMTGRKAVLYYIFSFSCVFS